MWTVYRRRAVPQLEDTSCEWVRGCTDRAQWAWRMLPTFQPCFPPHMYRSPHLRRSLGEQSRYGPLGFQICRQDGHPQSRDERKSWNTVFAWSINVWAFVDYLPLGRSESSFLQRTVGTGSPWTTQWNSTLSSANTTTLLGRFTKVGRSGSQHKHQYNHHCHECHQPPDTFCVIVVLMRAFICLYFVNFFV